MVALDQVFFWNRLGAVQPQGMIYALRSDVVPVDPSKGMTPGNVMLRKGKRPRPLVLRTRVGDCLEIRFENLLAPSPVDQQQPATRHASIHAVGMEPVSSPSDDGSNFGGPFRFDGQVAPGGSIPYPLYSRKEGQHVFHSTGAMTGGEGNGGSTNAGLFGAINVEPRNAEWYRSQVTRAELNIATKRDGAGQPMFTASGHPVIDWDATYPAGHPRAGDPILKMVDAQDQTVHGDLTAIVVGSDPAGGAGAGRFPAGSFAEAASVPGRQAAPLPRGHRGRRRGDHERQLPERAGGDARARSRHRGVPSWCHRPRGV